MEHTFEVGQRFRLNENWGETPAGSVVEIVEARGSSGVFVGPGAITVIHQIHIDSGAATFLESGEGDGDIIVDWNEAPEWATVFLKNIAAEGRRRDLYAWAEGYFEGARFEREDLGICPSLSPECWEIISTHPSQSKTGGLDITLKDAPKKPETSWIEDCEFPLLVISEEGRIVLATSGEASSSVFEGTLLNSVDPHGAGRHSSTWSVKRFKPYDGEVIIKNKGGQS